MEAAGKKHEEEKERLLIACQGTEGAYSQIAARRLFPEGSFLYFRQFRAAARAVSQGMCRYAVLPIENNTYGSVRDVYRAIGEENVSIVRGYTLKIDHVLLGLKGAALGDITTIYSHEQALGQCSSFLHSLGNRTEAVPCLNTAVSARRVAEEKDPYRAAIASPECAEIYGLEIIRRNIADNNHNYTRLICVGRQPEALENANRISLMLSLRHEPGSLASVLGMFAAEGINLLKIESEPIPGRDFEFRFYIDIEGHPEDEKTGHILRSLERTCPEYRMLGYYNS